MGLKRNGEAFITSNNWLKIFRLKGAAHQWRDAEQIKHSVAHAQPGGNFRAVVICQPFAPGFRHRHLPETLAWFTHAKTAGPIVYPTANTKSVASS